MEIYGHRFRIVDRRQFTETADLHRPQSRLVDRPNHCYEPGGRRFESCRARHSLREWLAPAVSSSPLGSLRSPNRWTSPAGRAKVQNEILPIGGEQCRSITPIVT